MRPAGEAFAAFLLNEDFQVLGTAAIDNVTGNLFPSDAAPCRQTLAEHLFRPVRWSQGIQTLIAHGAGRFIEVGHGNMLTKFGFFINRNVQHLSFRSLFA
jgi:[acyl-carrier-protein] S-malonyltransferase